MNLKWVRVIVFVLYSFGICSATEDRPASSERTMDTVVITAGRIEESKKTIVSSFTVIDQEEISQSSAKNLGELLAQKGIGNIKTYPGDLATIGIRGFRTDSHGNDLKGHVLILLNGRRAGTGNAAKIMTGNVRRVEIIRGPASVQYGSAAMGGVVNVITRQGEETSTAFAYGSFGGFGYEEISAGGSGAYEGFDFSVSVAREKKDDYKTGDGRTYVNTGVDNRENASLNIGYIIAKNHRIGFMYHGYTVEEAGSPSYLSQNDLDDYSERTNYSLDVDLEGKTETGSLIWRMKYFQGKDEDRWFDPVACNPDGYDDGTPSERTTESKGVQAQVSVDFGHSVLTTGVDWVDYEAEATWNPMLTSYENPAVFFLARTELMDRRLILSAGVRYDAYEVEVINPAGNTADDSNFTPNFGIAFLLTQWLKFRAAYSQSFVMPGADQMAASYTAFGRNYVGNPSLKPEKSDTYEGGFNIGYKSFSGSITYFHTDFEDKIEAVTRSNGDCSWDNVGKARIAGIEGELSFDIGVISDWPFEVKPYTGFTCLTDYEDRNTGRDLLEASDLIASYGLSVSDYDGFSARLNFSHIGERTVTDYESGWPYQNVKVESYTVADLTVSKRILEMGEYGGLILTGSVSNLFDRQYESVKGYPDPGRSFFIGLKHTF